MGKVMSRVTHQWYRFNAESRAHRVISQEKPSLAPKHPSSLKGIEEVMADPSYDKVKESTKDPVLDDNLKKVFVVSHDPDVKAKFRKPSAKGMLPINRSSRQETELGYIEPISVPKGKITLKQLMQILSEHQENPQVYDISRIAEQYRLSNENAKNILQYFSAFKLHMKEQTPTLTAKDQIFKYFEPNKAAKVLEDK